MRRTPITPAYRAIRYGVEAMPARLVLPRHHHRAGYANVVLAGRFTEASFAGRFTVAPGEALLHGAFDCHANQALTARGPTILRLPWDVAQWGDVPCGEDAREGRVRVSDPDRLARLAETDPRAAAGELAEMTTPCAPAPNPHWADVLAAALGRGEVISIGAWAAHHDLAPATVARGFARAFGTSPRRFRVEARARLAWRQAVHGRTSLSAIAHDLGFADLAHMTRSVRALTGAPPSAWRHAALAQRPDANSESRPARGIP